MINEYELYADERYHAHQYLMIGGLICTNSRRERLEERLTQVREEFNLAREMRWTKVSNTFLAAYKAWIDVFLKDRFARFSLLTVNMRDPDWKQFHPKLTKRPRWDDKLASAFYQFLLISFGKLSDMKRWWVYPDEGFFSQDKVLDRVEFLFNRTYKIAFGPRTSRIIRLMRARNSKAENMIQLVDVLLGAFSCNVANYVPSSKARRELADYCIEALKQRPKNQKGLDKFVVTCWVHPEEFSYP